MTEDACPSTSYCAWSGNGTEAPCAACPWGARSDHAPQPRCQRCSNPLDTYQWLYLGFYALLPLAFQILAMEVGGRGSAWRRRRRRLRALHHASCLCEAALASLAALLLVQPLGSLAVHTCGSRNLADWYTSFQNPVINFTTLHCSSEAVYPLYSLPFIYYGFCLIFLAIVRPLFLARFRRHSSGVSRSVYASLYFYPAISLCHALLAGLVYYSFPFLLLTATLVSNVLHLAKYPQQQLWPMAKASVTQPRNVVILLSLCGVYGYAIASITRFRTPAWELPLLLLGPLPSIFYIVTVKLTNPVLKFS